MANERGEPNLRVTIIAADGLYKRDVFRFPDPFAVATISGEQTKTTSVIKKTLNPYWNEVFDMRATEDSILAIQIFDQKKFKKKDQGFLGVINVRVGDVIDLDIGGDGKLFTLVTPKMSPLTVPLHRDAHERPQKIYRQPRRTRQADCQPFHESHCPTYEPGD